MNILETDQAAGDQKAKNSKQRRYLPNEIEIEFKGITPYQWVTCRFYITQVLKYGMVYWFVEYNSSTYGGIWQTDDYENIDDALDQMRERLEKNNKKWRISKKS